MGEGSDKIMIRESNYIYELQAFADNVLVVASVNDERREWAVYIGSVSGVNHDEEFHRKE